MNAPSDWPASFLYRDWDYFTSMAESLRLYLFRFHTVPTWNYMLCGGKPELANPQSWAFTWPSLFVYLLPPNAAMISLWIVMTMIGWGSMLLLLRRLGADRLGAVTGATLYAFNGYFAAHFGQGHVTFAFFHLVPLMMLLYARLCDASSPLRVKPFLAAVGVAFAFFSAALPHALFYFFIAFAIVLTALILRTGHRQGSRVAGRAMTACLASVGLGVLLAGYKLWPVVAWQLQSPRTGVLREDVTLADILANTTRFATDYDNVLAKDFANQTWFSWEYNAFIGLTPWIFLAFSAWLWLRRRRKTGRSGTSIRSGTSVLFWIGLVAVGLGLNLALGNGNSLSLAHWFQTLPLMSGIRVFSRFQILIVFGVACLISVAMAPCLAWIQSPSRRRIVRWVIPLLLVAPGIIETFTLIGAIRGSSAAEIARNYTLPPAGMAPLLVKQPLGFSRGTTDQTYLLDSGYWVANCYEPLKVAHPRLGELDHIPLTDPPPTRLLDLGSNSLRLLFETPPRGPIRVLLAGASDLSFDAPTQTNLAGETTVQFDDTDRPRILVIRRPLGAPWIGLVVSASGVALLGLALGLTALKKRRQRVRPF